MKATLAINGLSVLKNIKLFVTVFNCRLLLYSFLLCMFENWGRPIEQLLSLTDLLLLKILYFKVWKDT